MDLSPSHDATDDATLLAALRQGQARAFEQLMRRHNRLLFRAARGVLQDDAEAQDAVQEAWLKAFTALDSFRGDSSLATWLTRIAVHQAVSQQRKTRRLVAWNPDPADEEEAMPDLTDPDRAPASPEDELARRQLRERMQQAIDLLPPAYRSVFILRAVEGLSVEETAAALRVSPDVVKTRLLRARAMLRQHLQPAAEGDLAGLYPFLGQRCDDTVTTVIARLRALGVIRDQ